MYVFQECAPVAGARVEINSRKSGKTIFSKVADGTESFADMLADFRELTRQNCAFPCALIVAGNVCASTTDEF